MAQTTMAQQFTGPLDDDISAAKTKVAQAETRRNAATAKPADTPQVRAEQAAANADYADSNAALIRLMMQRGFIG